MRRDPASASRARESGLGVRMTDFPEPVILTPEQEKIVEYAERRVRKALYDLEQETGLSIDHVSVDTRNFGQLHTEIMLTKRVRQ